MCACVHVCETDRQCVGGSEAALERGVVRRRQLDADARGVLPGRRLRGHARRSARAHRLIQHDYHTANIIYISFEELFLRKNT